MRRMLFLAAAVAALVCAPPVALADSSTLPRSASLPWSDPTHRSPLEVLASRISSGIAGRQVSVICDGENDWEQRSVDYRFGSALELGFAPFRYDTVSRTVVEEPSIVFLAPRVCLSLSRFGQADVKPTKCPVWETKTQTVHKTVRYRTKVPVKVQKRVRVNGRWVRRAVVVKKTVWKRKKVTRAVTTSTSPTVKPCYVRDRSVKANEPKSYWQAYNGYAEAIMTLAHESIHLTQFRAQVAIDAVLPTSETLAECYGMQRMAWVAREFGAGPDDAQAIASYTFDRIYPSYRGEDYQGSPYWSAGCRRNGPLDLTPGDGVWP